MDRQIPRPRSIASVALEAWFAEGAMLQADVARKLSATRACVSAWVRGIRVPKVKAATKLQRLSRGRVALADWRTPAE